MLSCSMKGMTWQANAKIIIVTTTSAAGKTVALPPRKPNRNCRRS